MSHSIEALEKMKQQGAENSKAGEAFLAENANKEGVKTTDSGLQYKVITAGEGTFSMAFRCSICMVMLISKK